MTNGKRGDTSRAGATPGSAGTRVNAMHAAAIAEKTPIAAKAPSVALVEDVPSEARTTASPHPAALRTPMVRLETSAMHAAAIASVQALPSRPLPLQTANAPT